MRTPRGTYRRKSLWQFGTLQIYLRRDISRKLHRVNHRFSRDLAPRRGTADTLEPAQWNVGTRHTYYYHRGRLFSRQNWLYTLLQVLHPPRSSTSWVIRPYSQTDHNSGDFRKRPIHLYQNNFKWDLRKIIYLISLSFWPSLLWSSLHFFITHPKSKSNNSS